MRNAEFVDVGIFLKTFLCLKVEEVDNKIDLTCFSGLYSCQNL